MLRDLRWICQTGSFVKASKETRHTPRHSAHRARCRRHLLRSQQPDEVRKLQAARTQIICNSAADEEFGIPAAPILIPEGPWREVDGCVCAPKGFKAQGMAGGLRASGRKADIALIVANDKAVVGGAFTQNVMCAAPVIYCREVLARTDTVRAVLINAGQANAATGDKGYQDCLKSAAAVSEALGIAADDVLLLSTGVIGRPLKMDALLSSVPKLAQSLGEDPSDAHHAAVAITTTDLVSKSAALEVEIGGSTVRMGGIAKGSGMIHPNMATMLSVITTDAAVAPDVWQGIMKRGAENSFNQISVDGDTSTNDTVLGLASGRCGGRKITDSSSEDAQNLEAAVTALLQGLAKAIAWDGEGATCLLEVTATGAADDASARRVAKAVVSSSLVKSAVFGHDPNWGRIACAAGYAGVSYNANELDIRLGDIELMRQGQPLEFDDKAASKYLTDTTAVHGTVCIDLKLGSGSGACSDIALAESFGLISNIAHDQRSSALQIRIKDATCLMVSFLIQC